MTKEFTLREELLASLENVFNNFVLMLEKFDKQQINKSPFEGSWTAAQVADHITKSTLSITKALQLPGTIINRNPFERVPELKKIFLDFNTKLKSPDFIRPGEEPVGKEEVIERLTGSFSALNDAAARTELLEMINHRAFGDITKFEILHFVLYHTQRHHHQLEKIFRSLNPSPAK